MITADELQAAKDFVVSATAPEPANAATADGTDAAPVADVADIVQVPQPGVPAYPAQVIPVQLALPPDSDLVMVETRAALPPAEDVQEPEMPRMRRVRPTRTVIADEPLQMVETRKEQAAPR